MSSSCSPRLLLFVSSHTADYNDYFYYSNKQGFFLLLFFFSFSFLNFFLCVCVSIPFQTAGSQPLAQSCYFAFILLCHYLHDVINNCMPKSFWNSEQRQIRQTNKANRQTWKMGLGRKRLQKRIGVMAAETAVYRRKV